MTAGSLNTLFNAWTERYLLQGDDIDTAQEKAALYLHMHSITDDLSAAAHMALTFQPPRPATPSPFAETASGKVIFAAHRFQKDATA